MVVVCLTESSSYRCSNVTCYMSSQQHSPVTLESSEGCFGSSHCKFMETVWKWKGMKINLPQLPPSQKASPLSLFPLTGFAPPASKTLRNPARDPRPLTYTQACLLQSKCSFNYCRRHRFPVNEIIGSWFYPIWIASLMQKQKRGLLHFVGGRRQTQKINNTTRCHQMEGKQKISCIHVTVWLSHVGSSPSHKCWSHAAKKVNNKLIRLQHLLSRHSSSPLTKRK